ncbi:hypothetical protein L5515_015212 [Caenorhabditis briggsae]|uniref:MADF domain-containing protein n=1 Tax=Caenorhabditis briggsae TaxID=6238 RepID=A0AAE9EFI9_CAEBR|nr:hypothetical protein L5515_015212 [Caenorhabditis briggsae]
MTIPLYKLPPLVPLPELPESDPSRKLSVGVYWENCKKKEFQFDQLDFSNDTLKKVVLSEIERHPEIWSSRKGNSHQKMFPQIAVDVFKRTGILLSIPSIKSIYKCAKDNLRNRLRIAVVRHRLSPEDVERYMWRWDFYGFIRFYREHTQHWEAELLKEAASGLPVSPNPVLKDPVPRKRRATQAMEEDYGVVEEEHFEDKDLYGGQLEIDYSVYLPQNGTFEEPEEETPSPTIKLDRAIKRQIRTLQPPSDYPDYVAPDVTDCVSSSSTAPPNPAAINNFNEEMKQIAYQANRIAQEQPGAIKLLRRAFFDVVLAFDEHKFKNIGELYKELADKNTK